MGQPVSGTIIRCTGFGLRKYSPRALHAKGVGSMLEHKKGLQTVKKMGAFSQSILYTKTNVYFDLILLTGYFACYL